MLRTPLRYPGGKAKLFEFFANLIASNNLYNANYCEPYAGGAGLALMLLGSSYAKTISLNDIDETIFAFWISVLRENERFCELVEQTPIDVDEWHRQKEIRKNFKRHTTLEVGFSTYFLNRTNRSGIIESGGPIGGHSQNGKWKLDARFNRANQIRILESLSRFSDQVEVTNLDALQFIRRKIKSRKNVLYLDPPYYVKGHRLYKNFYSHNDHVQISELLNKNRNQNWLVSYDDVQEIREIYKAFDPIRYSLNYSAASKSIGEEVIFVSDRIHVPEFEGFRKTA